MKRYLAYSGRFNVSVEEKEGEDVVKTLRPRLTHQMQVPSFPYWLDNVQERVAYLDGEHLQLQQDGAVLVNLGVDDEAIYICMRADLSCLPAQGQPQIPTITWKKIN